MDELDRDYKLQVKSYKLDILNFIITSILTIITIAFAISAYFTSIKANQISEQAYMPFFYIQTINSDEYKDTIKIKSNNTYIRNIKVECYTYLEVHSFSYNKSIFVPIKNVLSDNKVENDIVIYLDKRFDELSDPKSILKTLPDELNVFSDLKMYISVKYIDYKNKENIKYFELINDDLNLLDDSLIKEINFKDYWASKNNNIKDISDEIVDKFKAENKDRIVDFFFK